MSFLSKFESAFKKLFGDTPKWVHIAQAVVSFAAPVALTALTVSDPALQPVAMPIITQVQADLATISAIAGDGTATPSLSTAVDRVQANLSQLLTEGHVTYPKSVANITLVTNEMKSLASMLPAQPAPLAVPAAS